MKEKPIAVISGASFGALRSGLYATRSIMTFSTPQTTIATISEKKSPMTIPNGPVVRVRPTVPQMPERDERPDHEDLAVGEVDELDDPVDERVAERDQGVDRAVGEPEDEVVAEIGEAAVLDEVVQAEVERQGEQHEDQPVLAQRFAHPVGGCPAGLTVAVSTLIREISSRSRRGAGGVGARPAVASGRA